MDHDKRTKSLGLEARSRTQSASTSASNEDQSLPRAYYNVRAARSALTTVCTLGGCGVANNSACGSFLVADDNRIFAANHRHCYGKKVNITASFNLETYTCNTCTFRGEHLVLHREVDGTDALDANPVCFVLSDQCFPPIIPVEGDGECVKSFRIEDGAIFELVDAFLGLTRGFSVPAGSVVVLASASHLARVGTAAYARDFVHEGGRLVSTMGGSIELVHCFPILLSGTEDSALIRSMTDLQHWLGHISTGRDISRARKKCFSLTMGKDISAFSVCGSTGMQYATVQSCAALGLPEAPAGTGPPEAPVHHAMSLELPVAKFGPGTCVFRSTGYTALPLSLLPCPPEQERALIDALIEDLNEIFMTNLATEFCTARTLSTGPSGAECDTSDYRFIVIGASHASRLASALRETGAEVSDLAVPGWKLSSESVEAASALLREVLEEEWTGETVVIYQLFDNSSYFGISADGTASLPVKGTDGHYHVEGSLGMIDKDNFKQLFSAAVPLLRAGGQNKKILISPISRYAVESCCSNRRNGLTQVLTEGLSNLETWMDDQAYLKRIRNFMVFNPNDFFSPDNDTITKKDARVYKQCWKAGPVHMTSVGYEKMAASLLEALIEGTFSRSGPAAPAATSTSTPSSSSHNRWPPPAGGQRKFDWSKRRQAWVLGSDAVAHRNYNDGNGGSRGRGRGGGKWRGHGGQSRGWGGFNRGQGRGKPY
jgi:hypothetical protein